MFQFKLFRKLSTLAKNPFKQGGASGKTAERITDEVIFPDPEVPKLGLISVGTFTDLEREAHAAAAATARLQGAPSCRRGRSHASVSRMGFCSSPGDRFGGDFLFFFTYCMERNFQRS